MLICLGDFRLDIFAGWPFAVYLYCGDCDGDLLNDNERQVMFLRRE